MTERKPLTASCESWVEVQIRTCPGPWRIRQSAGAGKRLADLDQAHDPLWWVKQPIRREQISMLPPSLELLRKVEKVLATIEALPDEATVRREIAALNAELAKVNATVLEGPATRLCKIDTDGIVARWQRSRGAMTPPDRHR